MGSFPTKLAQKLAHGQRSPYQTSYFQPDVCMDNLQAAQCLASPSASAETVSPYPLNLKPELKPQVSQEVESEGAALQATIPGGLPLARIHG